VNGRGSGSSIRLLLCPNEAPAKKKIPERSVWASGDRGLPRSLVVFVFSETRQFLFPCSQALLTRCSYGANGTNYFLAGA
jgi:hypothetical protein